MRAFMRAFAKKRINVMCRHSASCDYRRAAVITRERAHERDTIISQWEHSHTHSHTCFHERCSQNTEVSGRWATNYTVRETECCKHYEILTVSFRPFYLPSEFSQITVISVYVPGPDFNLAAERIAETYNRAVTKTGEQPVFILGDFNRCDISTYLPSLEQYVTTPTRKHNMLDLCFGNIPGAYISKPRPPLGLSDHNVILLLPKYRSQLKTGEIITKTISTWNEDASETLKGCFELTDWDVFFDDCGDDINMLSNVLTAYILFCEETVTPTKLATIYPKNKKWITKDMRACLVKKKKAFQQGAQSE